MLCRNCGATTSAALDRCEVSLRIRRPPNRRRSRRSPQPASTPNSPGRRAAPGPMPPSRIQRRHGFSPGRRSGRRCTIIQLLGAGGMGEVYHAWDGTLGAAVALKLIRVDPGAPALERRDLEARFKRELKLARQVTHPNVVRIHDLGEVEVHALPHHGVHPGCGSRYPAPAGADAAAGTSASSPPGGDKRLRRGQLIRRG